MLLVGRPGREGLRGDVQRQVCGAARRQRDAPELREFAYGLMHAGRQLAGRAEVNLRDVGACDGADVADAEAGVDAAAGRAHIQVRVVELGVGQAETERNNGVTPWRSYQR